MWLHWLSVLSWFLSSSFSQSPAIHLACHLSSLYTHVSFMVCAPGLRSTPVALLLSGSGVQAGWDQSFPISKHQPLPAGLHHAASGNRLSLKVALSPPGQYIRQALVC